MPQVAAVAAAAVVFAAFLTATSGAGVSRQAAADANALLQRAYQLHTGAGDLDAAIELYQRVVATDPANADGHHLLCVALHSSGRPYTTALQHCRQAVAIEPKNGNMWNTLGEVLRRAGCVLTVSSALASARSSVS